MSERQPLVFRMTEKGLERAVRRYAYWTGSICSLILVLAAIKGHVTSILPYAGPIAWGILAVGFTAFIGLGIQNLKRVLRTYVIWWDTQSIIRTTDGRPNLVFYHSEIERIENVGKGGFIITNRNQRRMVIPAGIERKEELRALLESIMPITPWRLWAPGWFIQPLTLAAYISFLSTCFTLHNESLWWLPAPAILINFVQLIRAWKNNQYPNFERTFSIIRVMYLGLTLFKILFHFLQ